MRKILMLSVLTLVSVCALALPPQRRSVLVDTVCNASIETMLKVTERFCYEFQACPDSLFRWAYMGLGAVKEESEKENTKESKNAIRLCYKDRVYDPNKKTGDVAIDIYVLGVRWWKDEHLGTRYTLTKQSDETYPLTAHMTATYSGSILEGGDFILELDPISPKQTRIHYEFRMAFGRTLSLFISDKTWHNAIEWRLETILKNLVECAETGTVKPKK